MRDEEIECLRKVLKGNTMNKLKKLKAIHCKSLETETSRKSSAWSAETKNISRNNDGQTSISSRSELSPCSLKDSKPKTGARKLLQRSISAAADRDHSIPFGHLRRSASLRRNSGSEVDANSVGLVALLNDKDRKRENCAIEDILNALRGPPYAVETFSSDDLSPLIQSDAEPFRGARNSFDNLEITESTSSLVGDDSAAVVGPSNDGGNVETKCLVSSQPTKRRKPELRILTQGCESSGVNCSLKKMSAVDERQMNEAIELANSFSRLSSDDKMRNGPRTPGSFSDSCHSPGGGFFSFRKNRSMKEEKKTFAGELGSQVNEANLVVTPAALEAYDALVKNTHPARTDRLNTFDENCTTNGIGESLFSESNQSPVLSPRAINGMSGLAPRVTENHVAGSKKNGDEFLSQTFPANVHRNRDSFALNRSLSLGDPERLKERAEQAGAIDLLLSSAVRLPDKPNEFDDLSPPAYPAPVPPAKLRALRPELIRQCSESAVTPHGSPPPPLPEKKSRRDDTSLLTEDQPPQYPAPLPPPPSVPPPALPPRVPLKASTVNSKAYERRFPLASEIPPPRLRIEAAARSDVVNCRSGNQLEKVLHQTSAPTVHETLPHMKEARSKGLCDSVESWLSCESDVGNSTQWSEEGVFSNPTKPFASGCCAVGSGDTGRLLQLNIKKVKLNATELGLHDKTDLFWVKSVSFDVPEKSRSESNLLQDVCAPIPGRYETSDSVSYEDLMEFALDGPLKTSSSHSLMCDEVRVLMKIFSNDITVEDCMDALTETFWDVHSAVKLIKLKQVMSTGLADKQQCKQALLFCRWNVNDAALYLLMPPPHRVTPDLVDV